eukprot:CAMPEP_0202940322 /NCGR_PEP_ID=MMETSP1395-20130829/389_1 /ASSEMBLY_ACC=CAM_ASM_000871 /TAXON_ID=5961 /ORGANISM="Blepharisma japonicum, Strain Stock R1072" /LENGTH=339 /DNA_ID=CAMNT_0049634741 /DNA_START=194 /DNA_END=1213 /DNA_ORIENTATION=+
MAACMDLIHSGHFNCMRQAKKLGDILVIGVISDDEIRRCKGPPVMNQEERRIMAEACKWADEVIDGVEYYVTPEILERVGYDYVIYGDDLAIRKDTGTDAYADVRAAGKLKIIKRTEGISTTDMVGKMLLMTSNELVTSPPTQISASTKTQFLSTTRRINQFSTPKTPAPTDRIVYIDGAFDLLHRGHVETIKRAREFGDYLIVGVHDDRTVNSIKGLNYPIMNLHERTLNLLALKYVDDVIMGAPWEITEDMIKTLNIQVVVQGTNHKDSMMTTPHEDPYTVPKRLGIYQEISSTCNLNAEDIVDRIVAHRLQYTKRNERMTANQQQYYENKQFVPEI